MSQLHLVHGLRLHQKLNFRISPSLKAPLVERGLYVHSGSVVRVTGNVAQADGAHWAQIFYLEKEGWIVTHGAGVAIEFVDAPEVDPVLAEILAVFYYTSDLLSYYTRQLQRYVAGEIDSMDIPRDQG